MGHPVHPVFLTYFFPLSQEAMIHSDASVDFAGDGSFLVTLVPSNMPMTTVVGVYGMSRATRGQGRRSIGS